MASHKVARVNALMPSPEPAVVWSGVAWSGVARVKGAIELLVDFDKESLSLSTLI